MWTALFCFIQVRCALQKKVVFVILLKVVFAFWVIFWDINMHAKLRVSDDHGITIWMNNCVTAQCFSHWIFGVKQWFIMLGLQSDLFDKRTFLSLLGFVIQKLTSKGDRRDRGERGEWHVEVRLCSGQLRTKKISWVNAQQYLGVKQMDAH